ncbi:classical arabinogalactan protein 4-like [Salvia miltiorrhiza]|uniref:classical arabinogalactan protein 4-like n=1 Tax=Salvia miltiorrhiza TaxID=226208 RepID=UPI0025AD3622|nr:classical arabinogalactan protein 4-like [Salvia miltiorrhiza]
MGKLWDGVSLDLRNQFWEIRFFFSAAILYLPPAALPGKTPPTAPSPSLAHAVSPASAASSPSAAAARIAPSPPPPPPSTPPASRTAPSAHPVYRPAPQPHIVTSFSLSLPGTESATAPAVMDSDLDPQPQWAAEKHFFSAEFMGVMQEIIRKEVRNYMVGMEMEKKGQYMQSDAMMINSVIKRMRMSKVD